MINMMHTINKTRCMPLSTIRRIPFSGAAAFFKIGKENSSAKGRESALEHTDASSDNRARQSVGI